MKRALIMAACVLTLGCASAFLLTQKDVTAKQRYFALVSDYTDAKEAALPIMKSTVVDRGTKQKILDVVRATDERIEAFETWRKTQNEGEIPDNRYELLNAIIGQALTELLKYGVQSAFAPAILVLLQILTMVIKYYGLDDKVGALLLGSIAKLKGFVDRGEDPTEEDFAELFAEFRDATNALEDAFAETEGELDEAADPAQTELMDWWDRTFPTDGESG